MLPSFARINAACFILVSSTDNLNNIVLEYRIRTKINSVQSASHSGYAMELTQASEQTLDPMTVSMQRLVVAGRVLPDAAERDDRQDAAHK